MIDFRYHVVSIIAVFLALSVGLVLGSSFLQESVVSGLDSQVQDLKKSSNSLRRDLDNANAGQRNLNNFISASAPELMDGKLTNRTVALVVLPGADSKVTDNARNAVTSAGGTVTSEVTIKPTWTDDRQASTLSQTIATGSSTNGQNGQGGQSTAPASPAGAPDETADSVQSRAATAFAGQLVHHTGASVQGAGSGNGTGTTTVAGTNPTPGATSTPSSTGTPTTSPTSTPSSGSSVSPTPTTTFDTNGNSLLARLARAGFVEVKGNPDQGATLAVVVAPGGAITGDDASHVTAQYLALTRALGGDDDATVLAGTGAAAQDGGLVSAMRGDGETTKLVSSVDSVDTTPGQVAVVWALRSLYDTAHPGQFGMVGTTDGWLPKLTDEGTTGS